MKLLRVSTAGNVDDGKSTLIGRLLHDTNSIKDDVLDQLKDASLKLGYDELHLALTTDGLKAEREQGITIDVAYRYFQTELTKIILADTPGHFEYTRNMVTGTTQSDVSIVLYDISRNETDQTFRHLMIAHLLRVKMIVICINKMDLVGYSGEKFLEAKSKIENVLSQMFDTTFFFIPVSALKGDNIIEKSSRMPWFKDLALLPFLDQYDPVKKSTDKASFSVQLAFPPPLKEKHQARRYAGFVSAGEFKKGDKVKIYPAQLSSHIQGLFRYQENVDTSREGDVISMELAHEIAIQRGDLILKENQTCLLGKRFKVILSSLQSSGIKQNQKYIARFMSLELDCVIEGIESKVDFTNLTWMDHSDNLGINEIGRGVLKFSKLVATEKYHLNSYLGSMILIDPVDYQTIAAVMIEDVL
jgi:sulfate adenylyltransferase subunit 1